MKLNFNHTLCACFAGYITQAVVNNFAPLLFLIFHEKLEIELTQITLLVTVNFIVQLFVDFIAPFFVNKIGYKPSIIAAHLFSSLGLILLGVLPPLSNNPFPMLLCAVVVYAIGGGIIEVLISPIAEACPTKNKSSVMSLLHSFYCWGTMAVIIISTLFLHFAGKDSWSVLSLLWALFPLFNAVFFIFVPVKHLPEEEDKNASKSIFTTKAFFIFLLLMVSAGASEQAMSQWASFFVEDALGIPKALGDIFGVCLFSLMMGIARILHSRFSEKLNLKKCLILSGILSIFSYFTVAVSPVPMISLIACALCGLSAGILWPGVFSMAAEHFPKGGTAMFAYLALAGDLGCSSGPTLTGFMSSLFDGNLKTGFLFAIIFPVILIISALSLKKVSH